MTVSDAPDGAPGAPLEREALLEGEAPLDGEALFEALARPGVLGPDAPERVDTHLSAIFLSGERAFKAMRAVDYGFVDFSTPAARRRACFAECARNPMAGDLYLGVRPVLRDAAGALRLGPRLETEDAPDAQPETIEHLVEMRRFDRAEEYDRLAETAALAPAEIDALADRIAAAHAGAPLRAAGADATRATLENVAKTLAAETAPDKATDLRPAAEAWAAAARAACDRLAPRLDARSRHGRVRRCHGDLHLGNIVRLDGAPRPFDAIVFNDALTDIDVAYDAAFTLMDLERLAGRAAANLFLSRYLSATRDYSALAVLPLFVSLRAAIRAMTSLLGGAPEAARPFLSLAERALRPAEPPRLICVGGGSGVGKSTLARALVARGAAAPLGPVWLRSDVTRKRMLDLAPEQPAPPEAYAEEVSQRVLARMAKDAGRALRAGTSVVADATFMAPDWRARLRAVADAAGLRFDGLFLEASTETRRARAQTRRDSGARDPSDADPEIAARQSPEPPAEPGWTRIPADGAPQDVHDRATRALSS